jgi:hypothetical protein
MKQIGLWVVPVLASCANMPVAKAPLTGIWGGAHIGLALDPSGGRLDYDCANGTVGPILPSADGTFEAQGSHTPAAGGPDRIGQILPSYPTSFAGRVRGDRMILSGRLENGVVLGPFELRLGRDAMIFRCL